MSFSSKSTPLFHNNGIEGDVLYLKPNGCMCILPIKKSSLPVHKFPLLINLGEDGYLKP